MDRRLVFGEAAEAYDTHRPDYPAEMIDDIVAAAGPGPALEVGAGTGKATTAFAARGLDLTAVEPDSRMAAVLRRRVAAYPLVRVVETLFEDWVPDRPYGLLFSGQAWHWVDMDRRNDLAAAALAPGGTLAVFWNASLPADRSVHTALAEVYERFGMGGDQAAHIMVAADRPGLNPDFALEWAQLRLHSDDRFTGLRSRRYHRPAALTSTEYADGIATTSHLRILDDDTRRAVLAAVVAAIDGAGGVIRQDVITDLALATRV